MPQLANDGKSAKFFLSHSSAYNAEARALADGLERAGLPIWCCQQRDAMPLGRPFTGVLERALTESRGCIVLFAKNAVAGWMKPEVDYVLNQQVRNEGYLVVPLLMPDVDFPQLPPFLARLQGRRLEKLPRELDHADFVELVRAVQHAGLGAFAAEPSDTCPFPGLEAFSEADARFFFGRDRDVRAICHKLAARDGGKCARWLHLHGASGVGKSSFIRAGLIPAVRRGWLDDVAREWVVATTRPGRDPLVNLAEGVAKALAARGAALTTSEVKKRLEADGGELALLLRDHLSERDGFLLFIDQFEELFTLGASDDPRRVEYERLIAGVLDDRDRACCVVTTTRSDFVEDVNKLEHLRPKQRADVIALPLQPMDGEALREAITGPMRRAGITWESKLDDRLVQDALEAEGGLPLLGHVLHALWNGGTRTELTHDAYQALGELGGALSAGADDVLARLPEPNRPRALRLLVQLVKSGRGTRDAKRTLSYAEALAALGGGRDARNILVELSGGEASQARRSLRLISISGEAGDQRVDLIHEALIRKWKTLAAEVEQRREEIEKRDDLELRARRWERNGKSGAFLLSEEELAYWEAVGDAGSLAHEFRAASRQRADDARRERSEGLRRAERRKRVLWAVGLLATLALGALALVLWQQQAQRALAVRERSSERAASARLLAADPRQSVEALKLATLAVGELSLRDMDVPPTASAALDAALDTSRHSWPLIGHTGSVSYAEFSPDGLRIVTASYDGTARVWSAEDGGLLATLQGHETYVRRAAFSRDGKRVVTASDDSTARVWSSADGRMLATLTGHFGTVTHAEFSLDGHSIVTASYDGTARVWNSDNGNLVSRLDGHDDPILHAVFSPDGLRIVTASSDRTARVWSSDNCNLLATLKGHDGAVWHAEFSPDSRRIVTASDDSTSCVWSSEDGRLLATLRGHDHSVQHAEFSPAGDRIVTASSDGTARVWNAENGGLLATSTDVGRGMVHAQFSPAGDRILTVSEDGIAREWDSQDGSLVGLLTGHEESVRNAEYSPAGDRIVTASADHAARVWSWEDGRLLLSLTGHKKLLWHAEFSPDGHRIVTASHDGTARVWSSESGAVSATLMGHARDVRHAEFSPDGLRIVTASGDRTARVWRSDDGSSLLTLSGHTGPLRHAEFSPDGQRIVTASDDSTARVWSSDDGRLLSTLTGHTGALTHAEFSPDGHRIVTASEDNTARVWSSDDGRLLSTLAGHLGPLLHAEFSPDGLRIVTASEGGDACVWSSDDGRLLFTLTGHEDDVCDVEFSPDGHRIVTASEDGTARVWSSDDGRSLFALPGHDIGVADAEFAPDGRRIVTAGPYDATRVWSADDGRLLATLISHDDGVQHVAFSPDGNRVVTADDAGVARVFTLDERELMRRACELLRHRPAWSELGTRYQQFLDYKLP